VDIGVEGEMPLVPFWPRPSALPQHSSF
jgi:hypothetical protein